MKDDIKIRFVAQIYGFTASIIILCEFPVILAIAIIMIAYEVELAWVIPVCIFSLMYLGVLFGITYGTGAYLTVKDDEVELRGFFGVMRKYPLADVEKIVYDEIKFARTTETRARLIIVDKHSTDRRMNIRANGKTKFIKLDLTKKVLKYVRTFWHGEIEDLPEKYAPHTNE